MLLNQKTPNRCWRLGVLLSLSELIIEPVELVL